MRSFTSITIKKSGLAQLLLIILLLLHNTAWAGDNCGDLEKYTVKPGDNLSVISQQYGHQSFWEIVYVANADQISNPNLIYAGQILCIPPSIVAYQKGNLSLADVNRNPFYGMADVPFKDANPMYLYSINVDLHQQMLAVIPDQRNDDADAHGEPQTEEEDMLDEFREAFKGLMAAQEQSDQDADFDTETEEELFLELDGMVLDETRTRIGRDFYDVFYRNWQAPEKARNFTVTVSEQPTPNLGTIISVSVNGSYTFRHRLQPRHDVIEEAGQIAVRMTYNHLEGNQQQMRIY